MVCFISMRTFMFNPQTDPEWLIYADYIDELDQYDIATEIRNEIENEDNELTTFHYEYRCYRGGVSVGGVSVGDVGGISGGGGGFRGVGLGGFVSFGGVGGFGDGGRGVGGHYYDF